MEILTATYEGSFVTLEDCPKPKLPEYAFIGRSNVGKSSLINMLTGRNGLAHVSNTPGKTQTINYFLINNEWYLVDLPGYGYARTNKKTRAGFSRMITDYMVNREALACTFVLIDSNIPARKNDIEFIEFLGENEVPFALTFTKADRLAKTRAENEITAIREALMASWHEMPPEFITSANHRTGREEVLNFIDEVNKTC